MVQTAAEVLCGGKSGARQMSRYNKEEVAELLPEPQQPPPANLHQVRPSNLDAVGDDERSRIHRSQVSNPSAVAVSTKQDATKAWGRAPLPGERPAKQGPGAAAPWWRWGNQASDQGWRGQPGRQAGRRPSPRAQHQQAMGQHAKDTRALQSPHPNHHSETAASRCPGRSNASTAWPMVTTGEPQPRRHRAGPPR